jgi:hypothetical protein
MDHLHRRRYRARLRALFWIVIMKTSELTGAALDAAVAQCESMAVEYVDDGITRCLLLPTGGRFSPSSNWAQSGPIIEREWVDLHCVNDSLWTADCSTPNGLIMGSGPTPLIAAMRCYVASKLGDDTP